MKTIGILGGMSWESTAIYYRLINEGMKARLGGLHSAKVLISSFDFHEVAALQSAGEWDKAGDLLAGAAHKLEVAGADCLVIATNTMHFIAPQIEARISVPLLHIADATGQALKDAGVQKVALLGTAFTMEKPFYRERLAEKFGLQVLVPDEEGRQTVHSVIYNELCQGIISASSRAAYQSVIADLQAHGAEAVILGCTEIGMLVHQKDSPLPLYDTTPLHAEAAVTFALG